MAISTLEKQRIEKIVGGFCQTRIPPHIRNQIQLNYTIRGNDIKIIESRPHWQNRDQWTNTPIARLKYDSDSLTWSLYWYRSNGRWEIYPDFKPTNDLRKVVNEIEKDKNHVFWG